MAFGIPGGRIGDCVDWKMMWWWLDRHAWHWSLRFCLYTSMIYDNKEAAPCNKVNFLNEPLRQAEGDADKTKIYASLPFRDRGCPMTENVLAALGILMTWAVGSASIPKSCASRNQVASKSFSMNQHLTALGNFVDLPRRIRKSLFRCQHPSLYARRKAV